VYHVIYKEIRPPSVPAKQPRLEEVVHEYARSTDGNPGVYSPPIQEILIYRFWLVVPEDSLAPSDPGFSPIEG
jgi:hypothetical protein